MPCSTWDSRAGTAAEETGGASTTLETSLIREHFPQMVSTRGRLIAERRVLSSATWANRAARRWQVEEYSLS